MAEHDKKMDQPKSKGKIVKLRPPTYIARRKEQMARRQADYSASKGSLLDNWLAWGSLHYAENADKWDYIADHLAGTVLDSDRIEKYLLQRAQGESQEYYAERAELSSYTPDFMNACTTLTGMLFANDTGVTRKWERDENTTLGDPNDRESHMHKFWQNSDGKGTNYDSFMFELATMLVAFGECWVLVEGWDGDMPPYLKVIEPQMVIKACHDEYGLLESVKLRTYVDNAASDQMAKMDIGEMYTLFYPKYYECWKHDDRGQPMQTVEPTPYGEGEFAYKNRQGQEVPPIFCIKMPFDASIGYLMAKKANTLFNHESSLDMLLHLACFPKMAADTVRNDGEVNSEMAEKIMELLLSGSSVIHGANSKYIAPPMDPAKTKHEIIKDKRRDFYRTFFQAYSDQAGQRTATEMKQDWAMNVQAFMSMFAGVMEEAENEILYRLEQAYAPGRPQAWGLASAEWNRDFSRTEDPMERVERMLGRMLPGNVPVDVDTLMRVVLDYLEGNGYPVEDDEAKAQMRARLEMTLDSEAQAGSMMNLFGG